MVLFFLIFTMQIDAEEPSQIHEVEPNQDHEVEPSQIYELEPSQDHEVEPSQIHKVEPSQDHEVEPSQIHEVEPSQDHEVEPSQLHEVEPSQDHEVEPNQIHEVEPSQDHEVELSGECSKITELYHPNLGSSVNCIQQDNIPHGWFQRLLASENQVPQLYQKVYSITKLHVYQLFHGVSYLCWDITYARIQYYGCSGCYKKNCMPPTALLFIAYTVFLFCLINVSLDLNFWKFFWWREFYQHVLGK